VLKVDGRRTRARIDPDRSGVEGLAVLGLDLKAVAGKREPMTDDIVDCFAIALPPSCDSGAE